MSRARRPALPIVADASAIVRLALHDSQVVADAVATGRVIAPEFMLLEFSNVLVKQVRFAGLAATRAAAALEYILELPISYVSARRLLPGSQDVALELGLTTSDAAYVALALTREAVLLTADQRLGSTYEPSQLVE